jgi:ribosomal protein L21E
VRERDRSRLTGGVRERERSRFTGGARERGGDTVGRFMDCFERCIL